MEAYRRESVGTTWGPSGFRSRHFCQLPISSPSPMIDAIKAAADDVHPDVVALRRTLHRHPELSGEEHETAQRVAEWLEDLGLDVQRGVYGTGVVGTLVGPGAPPSSVPTTPVSYTPVRTWRPRSSSHSVTRWAVSCSSPDSSGWRCRV